MSPCRRTCTSAAANAASYSFPAAAAACVNDAAARTATTSAERQCAQEPKDLIWHLQSQVEASLLARQSSQLSAGPDSSSAAASAASLPSSEPSPSANKASSFTSKESSIHPMLKAERDAKRQKVRERGKYASALFRKRMVTRTQILERHIRALGRAKAILNNHHWGKGVTSAAGVIIGEDDLLVAKSKTSMLAKGKKPTQAAVRVGRERTRLLTRALYSLNLADLTLADPTTNIKVSGTGEDILDNLTSTVRVLEWRNDMACGRVQRLTQLTSQFNATGRTLHASNLTQVHRFVTLLKTAQSVAATRNASKEAETNGSSSTGGTGSASTSLPPLLFLVLTSVRRKYHTSIFLRRSGLREILPQDAPRLCTKRKSKKGNDQRALIGTAQVLDLSDSQVEAIASLVIAWLV